MGNKKKENESQEPSSSKKNSSRNKQKNKEDEENTAKWSTQEEEVLLQAYNDKRNEIKQGNLGKGHWKEVCDKVNSNKTENDSSKKSKNQCKGKWNSLKRRYTEEKRKENSSGAVKSSWPLFDTIDSIIGSSPKIQGTIGAIDSGKKVGKK